MSEAKIGEFLENFDVRVSAGSLSNILTNTAAAIEAERRWQSVMLLHRVNSSDSRQTLAQLSVVHLI